MGAYMSQPDVAKHSEDVFYSNLEIGMSGMQGWRMSMEDAHCCLPNFDEKGTSLFGVFDGHGGKEVADYCAENMYRFLMDTEAFQEGDIKKALKDAFLNIDEAITTEEVIKELKGMGNDGGLDEEEEDEAAMLLEEANMPLGDLLERLKNSAQEQLDNESGEGKEEDSLEKNGEKETNGVTKPVENGTCDTANPQESSKKQSRKQKKPVKRNLDEIQTDIAGPGAPEGESLSIKGVAINISPGDGNSANVTIDPSGDSSAGSSNSVSVLIDTKVIDDDQDDPEYQVGDEVDDDEDEEEDYGEDDDSEDDFDDDDDDDEFEDSDGVEFQSGSDEVGKDSGTTAIVSVIKGNKLFVANVGDSRCVLCRNGKAIELSTDHKPEDEDEFSRIEKAGAKVTDNGRVNGGLNLSRALGDHVYKQNKSLLPEDQAITANPELREMELNKEDEFLVLACDGIWNVMTSDEVVQFIKGKLDAESDEKISLSKICEDLFDLCLAPDTKNDGSGCDNMTCMIIRFKQDGETSTVVLRRPSSEKRTNDDTPEENSSKSKKLKLSED